MADKTGIEWTDATWNPVSGCSLVSPGCTNCYAMHVAHRFARTGTKIYDGLTAEVNGKPVWTGKINVNERVIDQPLHPDWVRSLRDQCAAAGASFFFKQWGEFDAYGARQGKKRAGHTIDGAVWRQMPEAA